MLATAFESSDTLLSASEGMIHNHSCLGDDGIQVRFMGKGRLFDAADQPVGIIQAKPAGPVLPFDFEHVYRVFL
jgi:hypothetical protein